MIIIYNNHNNRARNNSNSQETSRTRPNTASIILYSSKQMFFKLTALKRIILRERDRALSTHNSSSSSSSTSTSTTATASCGNTAAGTARTAIQQQEQQVAALALFLITVIGSRRFAEDIALHMPEIPIVGDTHFLNMLCLCLHSYAMHTICFGSETCQQWWSMFLSTIPECKLKCSI